MYQAELLTAADAREHWRWIGTESRWPGGSPGFKVGWRAAQRRGNQDGGGIARPRASGSGRALGWSDGREQIDSGSDHGELERARACLMLVGKKEGVYPLKAREGDRPVRQRFARLVCCEGGQIVAGLDARLSLRRGVLSGSGRRQEETKWWLSLITTAGIQMLYGAGSRERERVSLRTRDPNNGCTLGDGLKD